MVVGNNHVDLVVVLVSGEVLEMDDDTDSHRVEVHFHNYQYTVW